MMQLYAFDLKGELVQARQALKQVDYQCLECGQAVRVRGGLHRQRHFFHVEPTPFCRQHQKGPVHLQLQSYFLKNLPLGDCELECSFPSIGRIADVVWHSQKIVFEIQCSPIRGEEVLARNGDYAQLGWQVVWILHDQRYNQMRLSAAEDVLRPTPHFFTNMDSLGNGIIYDQFDFCDKGIRLKRLPPLSIDIRERVFIEPFQKTPIPLIFLKNRLKTWNLFFSGDLISSFFYDAHNDYWDQAVEMEKLFYGDLNSLKWNQLPLKLWKWGVVKPYEIFFRFLLERACR